MNHPNKRQFLGVLARIDAPSDKSPSGGRGHSVILTRKAAEDALASLVGMAINLGGSTHKLAEKCGVIESAEISGNEILVQGHIWQRDLPEVVQRIEASAGEWGMSYELADAFVPDLRAEVWQIERCWFTGASVILREKAAYRSTQFILLDAEVGHA